MHGMEKKKKINSFTRLSTPHMNTGCRARHTAKEREILHRDFQSTISLDSLSRTRRTFLCNKKQIERIIRIYGRGLKRDIAPEPERLFNGNKFSIKIMVSAVIAWKGVSPPFFVADRNIKVNGISYLKHLKEELIPY